MSIKADWKTIYSLMRKWENKGELCVEQDFSPLSVNFRECLIHTGEETFNSAFKVALAMRKSFAARGQNFVEIDTLSQRRLPDDWSFRWEIARKWLGVNDSNIILNAGAGPYVHGHENGYECLLEARRQMQR